MTEQNPPDAPQEPAVTAQSVGDTIRALRALRKQTRAQQAAQNKILYPNASRGARIAGVPVASLPPELQRPAEDPE